MFPRLIARDGVLYFRLHVPLDVRPWFGRAEVWGSLKVRGESAARALLLVWMERAERVFALLRSDALSIE